MTFPDDLPGIIEYRVGKTVRVTLCHRPVQSVGTSGKTDAPLVCPQVPLGATGWRRVTENDWRPMKSWPASWEPFLNRVRPGPMDFRPLKIEELSEDD